MGLKFITGNLGKYKEAREIIPDLEMLDIDLPEIQTLDSHELIKEKIKEAKKTIKGEIVVEDGSLNIECLNSLPGPFIKWFLKTLDVKGLCELIHKYDNHQATASVILGYSNEKGEIKYFEGSVDGKIVVPRGNKGFSWDPIFEIEGLGKTFAELTLEEKNKVSMRRKAFEKLKNYLKK